MPLTPMNHVDTFRAEAERCAALARAVPHAAPLPHVRRWSAGGVVRHLVGDFRWASDIVETCQWNGNGFSVPRTRGAALLVAYDEASTRMADALAAAAERPDTACPNFAERGGGALGWWPRHQAHETLLHRWDIEAATGRHDPIDAEIAADGVDEALHVYTARYGSQRLDRPFTIACTDAPAAWSITPRGTGGLVDVARIDHPAAPDLACPATSLLLAVWKRQPLGDEAHFSDEATVRRFLSGPLTA